MPQHEISPCFVLIFFLINFARIEHWMASHCVSVSIMANPPVSIGSLNGIFAYAKFSIVPKEVVCVFFYVLDIVHKWFLHVLGTRFINIL